MKLEVFDPPMRCSSGGCGPKADPVLPRFTVDLEWLKGQGVTVALLDSGVAPVAGLDGAGKITYEKWSAQYCAGALHKRPTTLARDKLVPADGVSRGRARIALVRGRRPPRRSRWNGRR